MKIMNSQRDRAIAVLAALVVVIFGVYQKNLLPETELLAVAFLEGLIILVAALMTAIFVELLAHSGDRKP